MRVAIDATSLYGPRTGVGRFTSCVLAELAQRSDVEVIGFAVTWRGGHDLRDLLPHGIGAARGKMAAAPLRFLWRRTEHPRIERWTGAIDLVHGPNFVVPPSAARRVASVHDLTFEHYPQFCTSDVLQYPGLLRRAIRAGAWIHTDSSFVRDEVIDLLGAPAERVVVVPLGVDPPTSLDPRNGRLLAGGNTYVLALGTIEPRKNLPLLVDAFDQLAGEHPDLRLVIAGPDGWGVDAFDEALGRAHHASRVVRLGFVSESDRGDLLAGASAVAVPSHYEGFGLTAAEAMLAGTPVVASAAGSHPEVIADGGLLVPSGDRDALASALGRVIEDPALADDLRRRGMERARAFTWSATASGLIDLWRRAIDAS